MSTATGPTIWFWTEDGGGAPPASLVVDLWRNTIHYLVRCLTFITL